MLLSSLTRRALGAALILAGLGGAAQADNLVWTFSSTHPNIVDLEFYSQDRNHVWPGNGQVYYIDDYNMHTYNLNCYSGEKICYGAWVRGASATYWGVGPNNSQFCPDCCYTCGAGNVGAINLKP
mgnify:CR=1 FL=1|jgi:hypothetical protein